MFSYNCTGKHKNQLILYLLFLSIDQDNSHLGSCEFLPGGIFVLEPTFEPDRFYPTICH